MNVTVIGLIIDTLYALKILLIMMAMTLPSPSLDRKKCQVRQA